MKSTVIHTSVNIFEVSKRDNPQYFVDKVKDKRRTKQIGNVEARVQDSMVFHTQLRIIFDEGPGNLATVLCVRENDGC